MKRTERERKREMGRIRERSRKWFWQLGTADLEVFVQLRPWFGISWPRASSPTRQEGRIPQQRVGEGLCCHDMPNVKLSNCTTHHFHLLPKHRKAQIMHCEWNCGFRGVLLGSYVFVLFWHILFVHHLFVWGSAKQISSSERSWRSTASGASDVFAFRENCITSYFPNSSFWVYHIWNGKRCILVCKRRTPRIFVKPALLKLQPIHRFSAWQWRNDVINSSLCQICVLLEANCKDHLDS